MTAKTSSFLLLNLLGLLFSCTKTEEPQTPPTVKTVAATNIALTKATIGGEVVSEGFSAATDRGIVVSETNPKPSVSDTKYSSGYGIGAFTKDLDNLKVNTKYYYAAFATNTKGTSYGETLNFTTADYKLATNAIEAPKNITYTTAQLTGTISEDGGVAVSERGFVLNTTPGPTLTNTKIQNGTGLGTFSTVVTQLKEETTYYVRAYAINGKGTAYSNEISFSTLGYKAPTPESGTATFIGSQNVTLNGDITNTGGIDLIEKGFVFGVNSNVGLNDQKAISSTKDAGKYSIVITGLKANTKYYYKSYAINAKGTTLGLENSFTTLSATIPSVSTNDFANIAENSVRAGIEITNDGGSPITEYGVCISSTNPNPSILDRKVIFGNTIQNLPFGVMNPITGLTNGTNYYVKGYAINSVGVSYGNSKSFTTTSPISNQLKNGLVAFYPFNGNANDASGNNKNGSIVGGVSNTTDRFGSPNAAFLFNGSNGRIDVPSMDNLPYKPITYSAWAIVKSYFPDIPSGFQFKAIIGRNTAFVENNGVIGFTYAANNNYVYNNFYLWRGGGILTGPEPSSKVKPQLGAWVHIVFTQNSSGDWKWYQNGVLTNTGNFTDSQNQFDFFQIGSCNNQTTNNGNTYWNDKLDDIGVWNRVISESEVDYLYRNNFQP